MKPMKFFRIRIKRQNTISSDLRESIPITEQVRQHGGFGGFSGFDDLGDIFESFFGGGFGGSRRAANPNAPKRAAT